MRKRSKLLFICILLLTLVIAAFWYTNSYGSLAKKREMKQIVRDKYQGDIKFESIEYIEQGGRNVGKNWVVTYQVTSEGKCIKYRSWFSSNDIFLENTEREGKCT